MNTTTTRPKPDRYTVTTRQEPRGHITAYRQITRRKALAIYKREFLNLAYSASVIRHTPAGDFIVCTFKHTAPGLHYTIR